MMKTSSQVLFRNQGTSSGKSPAWRTGVRQRKTFVLANCLRCRSEIIRSNLIWITPAKETHAMLLITCLSLT